MSLFTLALSLLPCSVTAAAEVKSLTDRPWMEARTAHFRVYSCGPTQLVAQVAARLEQFRDAYASLAGAQSVASPPIIVMAFPDHRTMQPFLPLYNGRPANLAAFFRRDSDENLIVLYLAGAGSDSLEPVFHEYTHLLLRHNMLFWPMWLNEGMADIYSTFEPAPEGGASIGKPHAAYLQVLAHKHLMPLRDLFAVTHKSADYNERDRQSLFYAESWLLTHYLMIGSTSEIRSRFGEVTALLRKGQRPEEAFTNAFRVSLPQMETQLKRYLERGKFDSQRLIVRSDLRAGRMISWRVVGPVETNYRLGDVLMRVGQEEIAQEYFEKARKLGPRNPLPVEGLGLLAAERNEHAEAVRYLEQSLALGSASFLGHYTYAREKYRLTAHTPDSYTRVTGPDAAAIESELIKSIQLMPDFAPAHELLGFFLMAQGERLTTAEQHLKLAIQLEPENDSYLFSLAQLQVRRNDFDGAKRTLAPLRLSYVSPELRRHAEDMIAEINKTMASPR